MARKTLVTIEKIRKSLYDAYLDTEYREALGNSMIALGYVKEDPFELLFLSSGDKRSEYIKNDTRPLSANEISELIHLMMYKLRDDFQYGRFKPIAQKYLEIAEKMRNETKEKGKENNEKHDKKPLCNMKNERGYMFEMIGKAAQTLKQNNMYDASREMVERTTSSYDYDEAFNIIKEYIEPIERAKIQEDEEEFE